MQSLVIGGGNKLTGELRVQGAKNAVLPLLAASVLTNRKSALFNCPQISDSYAALRILNHLGAGASANGHIIETGGENINRTDIPRELMKEMRSSIIFMGALLGRFGECSISLPGGCDLGPRPIDLHIAALSAMGAEIDDRHGDIVCKAPSGLHGIKTTLSFPSVGATENIMLAASLADGETVINNAAREPEIIDLANFLKASGAKIKGAGSSRIIISGVESLDRTEFTVSPDRIAAATYLSYTAACGGSILLNNAEPLHMEAVLPLFSQMGCKVDTFGKSIFLSRNGKLKSAGVIRTTVYPGFPTDAQAVVMVPLCLADKTTLFVENIFENRYRHTGELLRMGADIRAEGKVAAVTGVKKLYGAKVDAPDLRGGAALVGAALAAEGESEVTNARYIDRGYENIEENIRALGGNIRRLD